MGDSHTATLKEPQSTRCITLQQKFEQIEWQNDRNKLVAYSALSLVSHAPTFFPSGLQLTLLQHAIANLRLNRLADETDLDDPDFIISCCAGLITVDKETGVVQLTNAVYDSPKFFSKVQMATSFLKIVSFPRPASHGNLLFDWAARNWGSLVKQWEHDDTVLELALSQLENEAVLGAICSLPAIHLIAAFGLERTCKIFLEKHPKSIHQRDWGGRTALSWAAMNGHTAVVKLLLDAARKKHPRWFSFTTSDVNIRDDEHGLTSLAWAAANGHLAVVKLLMDKANLNVRDNGGYTPLSHASHNGHLAVVKTLLDSGKANINSLDCWNLTPLFRAAQNRRFEVVELLLQTPKINVKVKNWMGETPLSLAAEWGHLKGVKMLLGTRKVDPRSKDLAMKFAIRGGHPEVARLLRAHRSTRWGTRSIGSNVDALQ